MIIFPRKLNPIFKSPHLILSSYTSPNPKLADFRLNPKLARNCHADIKNYCTNVKPLSNGGGTSVNGAITTEYNGLVLNCLKLHYNSEEHPLTSEKCQAHIKHLINRAIEDIIQDPIIADVCEKEVCL